jgi:hypothetical protein
MVPGVVGMFRLDVAVPRGAEAGYFETITLRIGDVIVPVLNGLTIR